MISSVRLLVVAFCLALAPVVVAAPAADAGAPPPTAATARHECSFVALGDRFYLLGGRGHRPVDVYDPRTKRWSRGAEAPIELHHFQAVAYKDRIYVVGALTGGYPAETPVPDVYVYEPKRDRWSVAGQVPVGRRRGAAGAVLWQGRIYVAGGLTEGHNGGFVPWLDAFDPEAGTWEQLPDAPRPRDHFHAVVEGRRLYLAGGRTTSAKTGHVLDLTVRELDVFDLAAHTWQTVAGEEGLLPTPRAGTSSVVFRRHVVVLGGESPSHEAAHDEVEAFDVRARVWRRWRPLHQGRHGTGAIARGDGIFVAAGSANRGGGPELDAIERWAP